MDTAAADLARQRWAKARRTNKTCAFCGCAYRGVKEQVYCTPKHQQAAAAQRLRDKRRAAQPAPAIATIHRSPVRPDPPGLAPLLERAEHFRLMGNLAEAARWQRLADQLLAESGSVE